MLHRARPFHGTIFQNDILFLHFGKHHRTGFIIDLDMLKQRARLTDIHRKTGILTHAIIPIFMVGCNRYDNIISTNLGSNRQHDYQSLQKQTQSFHFKLLLFRIMIIHRVQR